MTCRCRIPSTLALVRMQGHLHGAIGPTVYVVIDIDSDLKQELFDKKNASSLSAVQVILGTTSILCQLIIIILLSTFTSSYFDHIAGIGEGIYCGIFFIIAGVIGIMASDKPTSCNISAFMILSIIAAISSVVQIISSSINVSFILYQNTYNKIPAQEAQIAMFNIMIISALFEGVIAIICSAICCRSCCCTGGGGQVLYMPQGRTGPGGTPVKVARGFPIHMTGGIQIEMEYLSQPIRVNEALDQRTINVVKEELEAGRNEKK